MGYQNTPAHHTASAAWHAGDPVWPGNGALIIRRANVYPSTARTPDRPGANLGALGWAESIGPLIQALTAVGTTAYGIRRSQLDAQHERDRQNALDQAAAKAAAEAKAAAAAAAQQVATQQQAAAASPLAMPDQKSLLIGAAGLAVVGLGLYLFMRRK